MTDNEIKKALECCISLSCEGCPLKDEHGCLTISDENALALINRQQAEIERLKEFIAEIARSDRELKSEAIKEFAEKLKKRQRTFIDEEYAYEFIPSIEIDVLLAEKVGEQNA